MRGERQYAATDLSGRRWLFTESIADLAPEVESADERAAESSYFSDEAI